MIKLTVFKWIGRLSILFFIINTFNNLVLPLQWHIGLEHNLLAIGFMLISHYVVVETKGDLGIYTEEEVEKAHLISN